MAHLSLQIPYQVGLDAGTQHVNDDTVCPAEKQKRWDSSCNAMSLKYIRFTSEKKFEIGQQSK